MDWGLKALIKEPVPSTLIDFYDEDRYGIKHSVEYWGYNTPPAVMIKEVIYLKKDSLLHIKLKALNTSQEFVFKNKNYTICIRYGENCDSVYFYNEFQQVEVPIHTEIFLNVIGDLPEYFYVHSISSNFINNNIQRMIYKNAMSKRVRVQNPIHGYGFYVIPSKEETFCGIKEILLQLN